LTFFFLIFGGGDSLRYLSDNPFGNYGEVQGAPDFFSERVSLYIMDSGPKGPKRGPKGGTLVGEALCLLSILS